MIKCCYVGCGAEAEFTLYGSYVEDVTEACEFHVGFLLGTPVRASAENVQWTVVRILTG